MSFKGLGEKNIRMIEGADYFLQSLVKQARKRQDSLPPILPSPLIHVHSIANYLSNMYI